jgi:hypothetical protein
MADITFIGAKNIRGITVNGGQQQQQQGALGGIAATIISGLQGASIVSHITGTSFKVIQNSNTVAYGIIANVAGWTLVGNTINIVGPNPLTLNFLTPSEAQLAEPRIASIVNGHTVS